MNEWETVTFGSIFEIKNGLNKNKEYFGHGTPILNYVDVYKNIFNSIDTIKGKVDVTDDEIKRFKVNDNDLFFTRTSETLDEVGLTSVYLGQDKDTVYSGFLLRARPKDKNINSLFYAYYLRTAEMRYHLISHSSITTRASLNGTNLSKIKLKKPPIEIQNKIANMLFLIEKKIELNQKINNNLQRLIKNIIDFYFEKFIPFSNENMIESEIGLIPETWNIFKMKDIVKVLNGYSYKGSDLSESNIAMATIKNFDRNGGFKTDGFKEIIISDRVKPHHFLNLFDVILACTDLTQNADIIGNAEILLNKSEYDDIIMSMDLIKIESKIPEIGNYILHALLSTKRFKYHALGYVNGTTVLHMDKKAIPNYKLALPNDFSILEYINNILKPLYQSMSKNIHEIEKLTKLRDTLLPKLMSGELDVTNIDINFDFLNSFFHLLCTGKNNS